MSYVNTDLQSLPYQTTDLRVGTDQAERGLQLAYWQISAALQFVADIQTRGLYPEKVVTNSAEGTFDTEIVAVRDALVTALGHMNDIWAL